MTEFSVCFESSIANIGSQDWQLLFKNNGPFTQYQFLHALESSGSVGKGTGWMPQHIVVKVGDIIVAAMPNYLKQHSYGEYMFDWNIANAYHQNHIEYYPKFVSAVPFTPATSKRIAISEEYKVIAEQIVNAIISACDKVLTQVNGSNCQWLFLDNETSNLLASAGTLQRYELQYHWLNKGYDSFAAFCQSMVSRKRKNILKERRKVAAQGFDFVWLTGSEVTKQQWQRFYEFYQLTYLKRSGHNGYLTSEFFQTIGQHSNDNVLLFFALNEQKQEVAASLFFKDNHTLYGRYWGCEQEYDFLHFETCYYQGIEYCIKNNLQRFDAGAQGEHKLKRGFEPVLCFGNYLIRDKRFKTMLKDYFAQERQHFQQLKNDSVKMLPFKSK